MSAKDITINDILTVAIKNKRFVNAKIVHQKYWDKVFEDLNNINSNELEKNMYVLILKSSSISVWLIEFY